MTWGKALSAHGTQLRWDLLDAQACLLRTGDDKGKSRAGNGRLGVQRLDLQPEIGTSVKASGVVRARQISRQ